MAIKSFNLTAREQVQHARTRRRPVIVGQDAYVPNGDTESWHYTGPWADMLRQFEALDGTLLRRVEATLTRTEDGEFGELAITYTDYMKQENAIQGDPDGALPGSSRELPQYELGISEANAPLLTHPLYAELPQEQLTAAHMYMTGSLETDMVTESKTVGQLLDDMGQLAVRIRRGQTEFLQQSVTLTAKYRAGASGSVQITPFQVVTQVPGGISTPAGRNWLTYPASRSIQGREVWVGETYKLSGPAGWDKELY